MKNLISDIIAQKDMPYAKPITSHKNNRYNLFYDKKFSLNTLKRQQSPKPSTQNSQRYSHQEPH